jgi:hypothetical protein
LILTASALSFRFIKKNLRFQGTLSYPKISWKTLQVEFFWNAFTSLEFHFGAFHCPFTPQQIASFPLSENLTSRKKILLRFAQNQCEIEYQGEVLGTIPWEGKGGLLSWVAPEIAELSALHLSGSYDFKALESFSQALQNYNKENPPLTSGVEVKRYRGTEFIWLEEELRLPRFESQFEEPLFQKEPPFALRWKAWIYFPQAGKYTFYWDADEGVRFYIFGDLVLDTFKLNTAQGTPEEIQQKKKVTKELPSGFYPY